MRANPSCRNRGREALLLRSGKIFEPGRAVEPERDDRLHRVAMNLRERGRDLLGDVVDAAADQILHRRPGAAIGHMRDLGAHGRVGHSCALAMPENAGKKASAAATIVLDMLSSRGCGTFLNPR
jgi:hypothetical protein